MRFTIERIRTIVLIAGFLLVATLGVFLAINHWKIPLNRRDLPKKLGIDIQQEANGFTHAEFHAGHALFKITASKVEQLKNDQFRLHSVKIEMYGTSKDGAGKDGATKGGETDRIEGEDFEYDQKAGIATAAGPVEITLDQPATTQKPAQKSAAPAPRPNRRRKSAVNPILPTPESRQIHVKTVGLIFDQNSGVATSNSHVAFDLPQGSGESIGASYDSQNGLLVLNSAVDLNVQRGVEPVHIRATHAEVDRDAEVCHLTDATARYRHGDATAKQAVIHFRDDNTAEQLDASNGLVLTTATGGRLAASTGRLQFDEHNQPTHGHLEGGVIVDSQSEGRTLHGTAPTAELQFTSAGLLRHAHLERNVNFTSDEQRSSSGGPMKAHRTWASPVADLEFRDAGNGQVELDSLHGIGGAVVTSESQRGNSPEAHARMTADDLTGTFGANSALTKMVGVGHANLDQTTETGTRQTTTGDRLEAHFSEVKKGEARKGEAKAADVKAQRSNPMGGLGGSVGASSQIESATMIGNVVLFQQAAAKAGAATPAPLRATAQRADYEGDSELLHLTGKPHVDDGGLQLDAEKIDVARASGDAFAHGDVKATWINNNTDMAKGAEGKQSSPESSPGPGLGSQGPTHAIAAEAQLHQATGEATFRGNARLWQQVNSVSAPVIVLDRTRQTLVARTTSVSEPVNVVLLSTNKPGQSKTDKTGDIGNTNKGSKSPSVIRVHGGDLKYSDAEHKAVMHKGALNSVVAETGDATTHSNEVELTLLPPGNHAGKDGAAAQVDHMMARGHVLVDSENRHGTGEQLDYSSERGEYVLTGTTATPPRMTDPTRGAVTGESLIFNSRDDSVNVEGGGRETTTETSAPKRQ